MSIRSAARCSGAVLVLAGAAFLPAEEAGAGLSVVRSSGPASHELALANGTSSPLRG